MYMKLPFRGMIKKQRIWGASQRDKGKTKEKKVSVESGASKSWRKKTTQIVVIV